MKGRATLSGWILPVLLLMLAGQVGGQLGSLAGTDARKHAMEVMRLGTIRIRTPRGTDIMLRIGMRPFRLTGPGATGGALRVAPIEQSCFGQLSLAEVRLGAAVGKDVVFEVDNGRVTRVRAAEGANALSEALAASGDSAGRLGELSLGFDPKATAEGDAAGVVCLGFGGNQALGGAIPGAIQNRYCLPDATVHVDFRYLARDGKLVP